MNLIITAPAARALSKMPTRDAEALREKLTVFAADPFATNAWAKRLTGSADVRVRHGDWRAICRIDRGELTVFVVKVGNRREVYE